MQLLRSSAPLVALAFKRGGQVSIDRKTCRLAAGLLRLGVHKRHNVIDDRWRNAGVTLAQRWCNAGVTLV